MAADVGTGDVAGQAAQAGGGPGAEQGQGAQQFEGQPRADLYFEAAVEADAALGGELDGRTVETQPEDVDAAVADAEAGGEAVLAARRRRVAGEEAHQHGKLHQGAVDDVDLAAPADAFVDADGQRELEPAVDASGELVVGRAEAARQRRQIEGGQLESAAVPALAARIRQQVDGVPAVGAAAVGLGLDAEEFPPADPAPAPWLEPA